MCYPPDHSGYPVDSKGLDAFKQRPPSVSTAPAAAAELLAELGFAYVPEEYDCLDHYRSACGRWRIRATMYDKDFYLSTLLNDRFPFSPHIIPPAEALPATLRYLDEMGCPATNTLRLRRLDALLS